MRTISIELETMGLLVTNVKQSLPQSGQPRHQPPQYPKAQFLEHVERPLQDSLGPSEHQHQHQAQYQEDDHSPGKNLAGVCLNSIGTRRQVSLP